MATKGEYLSPVDASRYQGRSLLDTTMRSLLGFEGVKPPVVLGDIRAQGSMGTINVAVLVNAFGFTTSKLATRDRVTEIFKSINAQASIVPTEGIPPFPELERQRWFSDTSVIGFNETIDGVDGVVFVCISPDKLEADRMLEVVINESREIQLGKKETFTLGRLL